MSSQSRPSRAEQSEGASGAARESDGEITTGKSLTVKRSRLSRTGAVVMAVISVVGTAAGVFGVVQAMTRDTTNFSHLQISAGPTEGATAEWAVPEDALDRLPDAGWCGEEMTSWLESNATPLRREVSIKLRNDATEGPMLALTDFRPVSTVAEKRGPLRVRLVCDPAGSIPSQIYHGRVDADKGTTARHVRVSGTGAEAAPPVPVAFNLAPGESGTIPVGLFSRMPVSGSLEATVLSGKEEKVVAIPGTEFELPALLFAGDMYLITTDAGLLCVQTEKGVIEECTLDELKHEVAMARK